MWPRQIPIRLAQPFLIVACGVWKKRMVASLGKFVSYRGDGLIVVLASVTTSGKGKMLEILPHLQKQSECHQKMVYNMHLKIEAKRCRSSRDNWELRTCRNYEHLVDNSSLVWPLLFQQKLNSYRLSRAWVCVVPTDPGPKVLPTCILESL